MNEEFAVHDVGYSGRAVSESHRSSLFPLRFRSTAVAPSIVAESIDRANDNVNPKLTCPPLAPKPDYSAANVGVPPSGGQDTNMPAKERPAYFTLPAQRSCSF